MTESHPIGTPPPLPQEGAAASRETAIELHQVSKTFASATVVDKVDMAIPAGEIRALVGQNGCGKSTLIKILAGVYAADEGSSVTVAGESLPLGVLNAGDELGLRFVHQDLGLVDSLNAVENLALGHGFSNSRFRPINWRREAAQTQEDLHALGYDIDVRAPVSELAASERTAIAVARALSPRRSSPVLLVLDEPTASLPAAEVTRLFDLVRTIQKRGVAILFVSHHLNEVFELADRVTVLRDGKHVCTLGVDELDEGQLITHMVGRELAKTDMAALALASQVHTGSTPVLSAKGLAGATLSGLDLDIVPGEVVGVAGITGSGREAVAPLIFGALDARGQVTVNGASVRPGRPDLAVEAGVGYVPSDRHANAAFMKWTLRENVTVVKPGADDGGSLLSIRAERKSAMKWLTAFAVKPPNTEAVMETLSGGNQQKLILARWLRQKPKVLLLDEPTQGVDVGAKADIHAQVDEAAAGGAAVLVCSTDNQELGRLCHRVLILSEGRVVDEIEGGPGIDGDLITARSVGTVGHEAPDGDNGVPGSRQGESHV